MTETIGQACHRRERAAWIAEVAAERDEYRERLAVAGEAWDAERRRHEESITILSAGQRGADAERGEWKKRALAAEAQVDTLARELGAREASEWPGVVEGWKQRAEKAEAVIEKARSKYKNVWMQLYDDDIERLTDERDQTQEQLGNAREIIERLFAVAELHGVEKSTKTSTFFADAERFLTSTEPSK